MTVETRVERIKRSLASGEIELVFVITNGSESPRTAWIDGAAFKWQWDVTLRDLADRAPRQYRMQREPAAGASVLIVDCRS